MALSILPSCSEKFSVAAPYKSITVVYGLLDIADTAHYVRIQKAFLDDNKNSLSMAKEADSSFFNNLNVRIQRLSASSGKAIDTIHLNRVDLTAEGYPKPTGIFFNTPNYAYKFKGQLNPAYIYRIIVNNPATGEIDSAETPIIDTTTSAALTIFAIDDHTKQNFLDFTSTNSGVKNTLGAAYVAYSGFNYNGLATPVALAQCFIRFNWADTNTAAGTYVKRSYDYDLGFKEVTNKALTGFEYTVFNISLYNAIRTGMLPAPPNVQRLMSRCELIMYLGTNDFYNYIKVAAQQGVGLTGSEIQPTFTNIKGKNVLGLFTSRTSRGGFLTISPNTIAALKSIDLMAEERIVGTTY